MSLSGSTAFLLYKLFYPLAVRYFPPQWRRNMLLLAMAFFLIPFPNLKYYIVGLWLYVKPLFVPDDVSSTFFDISNGILLSHSCEMSIPLQLKTIYAITIFSTAVSVAMLLYRFGKYRKAAQLFLSICKKLPDDEFQTVVEQVGVQKRKVSFYSSTDQHCPVALGIIHPAVIVPVYLLEDIRSGQHDYLLTHELTHIKSRDAVIKVFANLIYCIHWFNPISYFLLREINFITETCCDSEVTKSFSEIQVINYTKAILNLACGLPPSAKLPCATNFSNENSKLLQRRLTEMKFFNHPKKKGLALLSAAAICLCTMPTALAYSNPPTLTVDSIDMHLKSNFEVFVPEGGTPAMEAPYLYLPYDCFFTDESGNTYADSLSNAETEKATCKHSYVNGTHTSHALNGKGGCTVTTYAAQRCTKCGSIVLGNRISTTQYDTCPH